MCPAVHELWTGELAYSDMPAAQVYFELVQRGAGLQIPEGCEPRYAAVMQACMRRREEERWAFDRILAALRALVAEWKAHG